MDNDIAKRCEAIVKDTKGINSDKKRTQALAKLLKKVKAITKVNCKSYEVEFQYKGITFVAEPVSYGDGSIFMAQPLTRLTYDIIETKNRADICPQLDKLLK